jgi:hypothetical protein
VRARARARVGALSHTTGRAASKAPPSASGTPAVARRRPGTAHTPANVVTDAVFHAPMLASKAFAQ